MVTTTKEKTRIMAVLMPEILNGEKEEKDHFFPHMAFRVSTGELAPAETRGVINNRKVLFTFQQFPG